MAAMALAAVHTRHVVLLLRRRQILALSVAAAHAVAAAHIAAVHAAVAAEEVPSVAVHAAVAAVAVTSEVAGKHVRDGR